MPSEYCTWLPFPGNCAVVLAGTWLRPAGKVTGKCPPGSVWPNRTLPSAVPLLWPGYQASSTPATWDSQGIATGAPALITTTVCGFAAATAEISSSCADGRFSDGRSAASDSVSSETTTTAAAADWAALAAAVMSGASAAGVPPRSCDDWALIDSGCFCPAGRLTTAGEGGRGGVGAHRRRARVVDDLLPVQRQGCRGVAAAGVHDGQDVSAGRRGGQRAGITPAGRGG